MKEDSPSSGSRLQSASKAIKPVSGHDKHVSALCPRSSVLPSFFCPTVINEFILVPLHSEPAQAVQEIDRLYDVFEEVSTKWNNQVSTQDFTVHFMCLSLRIRSHSESASPV